MNDPQPNGLKTAMQNAEQAAARDARVAARREAMMAKPTHRLGAYQSNVGKLIDEQRARLVELDAEYDTSRTDLEMQMEMEIERVSDEAEKLERMATERRAQVNAMKIAKNEKLDELKAQHMAERKAQERIIAAHRAMQEALGEIDHEPSKPADE